MKNVLLVGGGRWGRIIAATVLGQRLAERITLVTEHNLDRCRQWAEGRDGLQVVREIPVDLARFDAGIIATRPSKHADAAITVLRGHLPVLVEKPFAAHPDDERTLLDLADRMGTLLAIDHEFLLASWALELSRLLSEVKGLHIVWREQRSVSYGTERRTTDLSVTAVRDLMPHVLSILTVLLGASDPVGISLSQRADEDGFEAEFSYAGVRVTCEVLRNSTERHRRVYVNTDEVEVNWDSDKATLTRAGGEPTALGDDQPGTLVRALTAFLAPAGDSSPLAAENCRHILDGTWAFENALTADIEHTLTTMDPGGADVVDRVAAVVRTRVAGALERSGLIAHAGDWDGVAALSRELALIATRMADAPFTPLEDLRARLGRDHESFTSLIQVFQQVPDLSVPLLSGQSAKYWRNTLLPMESAGVFDAVLAGKPRHPYRVGLYPGPVCMFHCTFCARIEGERYDAAEITTGEELLGKVIEEAPTDDPATFYISGGLEPLTNPTLGGLVQRAAARGFEPVCYSNGFALTPQTLTRQPGLWDLGAIRISLYGLDEQEYAATTRRTGAFGRVQANVARFLQLREDRGARLRVGMNYVVLPGRAERLPRLIDYIAKINEAAPNRPIDYLTLREDYSGRDSGRLPESERQELLGALCALEGRADELTPTLHIDYGYALQTIRRGGSTTLPYSSPELMRGRGYPQASVVVDLRGDVYLYREAAFPGLPGALRYVIGRVSPTLGLEEIVSEYLADPTRTVEPVKGDEFYLDAFDQVVTARLRQLDADVDAGWAAYRGLLR
ncbi:dTDP-4-amino-4,6-dideoxy-D-glucose ammonia-lyase [Nocardia sp. NPDC051570]|uniref:dTDP-4-amino-4,6-dideoxy-D-glucose ammonia-lyase n=1 Tax=Nocardia sp. NPDC051570 TaxID=3364324 RepID=UPI003795C723